MWTRSNNDILKFFMCSRHLWLNSLLLSLSPVGCCSLLYRCCAVAVVVVVVVVFASWTRRPCGKISSKQQVASGDPHATTRISAAMNPNPNPNPSLSPIQSVELSTLGAWSLAKCFGHIVFMNCQLATYSAAPFALDSTLHGHGDPFSI